MTNYANNDHWYDDTSDGPVTATVKLKSGENVLVKDSAWIIVAPPKFAPYHHPIITLYDAMRQVAIEQKWLATSDKVSFTQDIYPILLRAVEYRYLNQSAERGHGYNSKGNFIQKIDSLSNNGDMNYNLRNYIFELLRNPDLVINNPEIDAAISQANFTYMP